MIAELNTGPGERSVVAFTQCAWCGGISVLGHYLRLPGVGKMVKRYNVTVPFITRLEISVSHGICPPCAEGVYAAAATR